MPSHESTEQSLHVFRDSLDAIDAAVADLTAAAERAVRQRGRAVLALGTSPACRRLCRRWADVAEGWAFWPYLLVFESEQRAGGRSGADAVAGDEAFSRTLPVHEANTFHVPRTASVADDANRYERTIRMVMELRPDERPHFDRVLCELASSGSCGGNAPGDWGHEESGPLAQVARTREGRVALTALAIGATAKLVLLPAAADAVDLVRMWSDPNDPTLGPMRSALARRGTAVALYAPSHAVR